MNKGDRIKLTYTDDQYTKLVAGDEGTVVRTRKDAFGDGMILDVDWDSGSTMSLIEGEDQWEVLP